MASIRAFLVQLLADAIRLALAPEIQRWSMRVDQILNKTESLLGETQAALVGLRELMVAVRSTQSELLGLLGQFKKPNPGILKVIKEMF